MKTIATRSVAFLLVFLIAAPAFARDKILLCPIADAMQTPAALALSKVQFHFGTQSHPPVQRKISTVEVERSDNALTRSNRKACAAVFVKALTDFYKLAKQDDGNAVVNIVSLASGEPVTSADKFVCRVSTAVARVHLEGEVVVLPAS